MIDACKRASAGRVTAVIPYFGYARQDRKAKSPRPHFCQAGGQHAHRRRRRPRADHGSPRQPRSRASLISPWITCWATPSSWTTTPRSSATTCENMVVVSPDVGSVARARTFAQKLHMNLAIVDKRRQKANQCEVMNVIGDVAGKDCILFDDMVDTAGSICNAAKAIVEVGGANSVYACASHGVLSGPAHRAYQQQRHQGDGSAEHHSRGDAARAAKRSSTCPWPPCLPRPSSASIRRSPSPSFLTKAFQIHFQVL